VKSFSSDSVFSQGMPPVAILHVVEIRLAQGQPGEEAEEEDHRHDGDVVRLGGDEEEVRVEHRHGERQRGAEAETGSHPRVPQPAAELGQPEHDGQISDAEIQQGAGEESDDDEQHAEPDEGDSALRPQRAAGEVEVEDAGEDSRQQQERDRRCGQNVDEVFDEFHVSQFAVVSD